MFSGRSANSRVDDPYLGIKCWSLIPDSQTVAKQAEIKQFSPSTYIFINTNKNKGKYNKIQKHRIVYTYFSSSYQHVYQQISNQWKSKLHTGIYRDESQTQTLTLAQSDNSDKE